ncbi:MAG TPA: alpha/beta hydrolase [Trebonia sp.]|jgi:pimeloyl-ACP methyl ester carboxylesterase|nr:alpha/beta hydrolase [Trebonia sp.]
MDIILIPGMWLDGSAWEQVVPLLERAGHRAHPVTLPGMESKDADRTKVTLDEWVSAVTRVIDDADPAAKVVLVGHSAGSAVAHAALDARADRVAHIFYVGGFPSADGHHLVDGYEAEGGEIPLPDWSGFDDADIADLDEAARAEFRARAIPAPELLLRDQVRLTDDRRHDVPATEVCTEYTAKALRDWMNEDPNALTEFRTARHLEYVDLHSGHWPQFTRPEDLATVILDRL